MSWACSLGLAAIFVLVLVPDASPAPAAGPKYPAGGADPSDIPSSTFSTYSHRVFTILGKTDWREKAFEFGKKHKIQGDGNGVSFNDAQMEEIVQMFEWVQSEDIKQNNKTQKQLDHVKRVEIDSIRKRQLPRKKYKKEGLEEPTHLVFQRLKFTAEDLKLLLKAQFAHHKKWKELRDQDYKTFQMEKKFQEMERLRHMNNDNERKEYKVKMEEERKEREKQDLHLKHPMTKDQNEDAWEKKDHLPKNEYNPRTYFSLHDLDSDGYLDEDEVMTILEGEFDESYDRKLEDPEEKSREMDKMYEHIYQTVDLDKDGLISFEEFKNAEDNDKPEDWEPEVEDPYKEVELEEYERQRIDAIRDSFAKGEKPEKYNYTDVPLLDDNFMNETHYKVDDFILKADDREIHDEERLKEYKEMQMMEKFRQEQEILHTQDEEERQRLEKKMDAQHQHRMNKPLSKAEIELVWETQDHKKFSDYKSEEFFHLHDVNTNGFLDKQELRLMSLAQFINHEKKQADKLGNETDWATISAMVEISIEQTLKICDLNKDQHCDLEEFLKATDWLGKVDEHLDNKDNLHDESQFTEEEFQTFKKTEIGKIRTLIAHGKLSPSYNYTDVPQLPGNFINSTHFQRNGKFIELHLQTDEEKYKNYKRFLMMQRYALEEELHKGISAAEKQKMMEQMRIQRIQRKHRMAAANVPMSKKQEEEDWKEDGMDQEDFGPEKYFHLHDTDQDGRLSQEEIIVGLMGEIDKLEIKDEEEKRAKIAEWLRYVYKKDRNNDRYIDLEEFKELSNASETEEADFKEEEMREVEYDDEEYNKYKQERENERQP